jgi:hypothetical protein
MPLWMTAPLVGGAAVLGALVARYVRRRRAAAQNPQNIYPLW